MSNNEIMRRIIISQPAAALQKPHHRQDEYEQNLGKYVLAVD